MPLPEPKMTDSENKTLEKIHSTILQQISAERIFATKQRTNRKASSYCVCTRRLNPQVNPAHFEMCLKLLSGEEETRRRRSNLTLCIYTYTKHTLNQNAIIFETVEHKLLLYK